MIASFGYITKLKFYLFLKPLIGSNLPRSLANHRCYLGELNGKLFLIRLPSIPRMMFWCKETAGVERKGGGVGVRGRPARGRTAHSRRRTTRRVFRRSWRNATTCRTCSRMYSFINGTRLFLPWWPFRAARPHSPPVQSTLHTRHTQADSQADTHTHRRPWKARVSRLLLCLTNFSFPLFSSIFTLFHLFQPSPLLQPTKDFLCPGLSGFFGDKNIFKNKFSRNSLV
jgi:hypothetical protein